MRLPTLAPAVALACAVALAGCGSEESPVPVAGTATPSPDSTATPSPDSTATPADFPLAAGMVEDGGDVEVSPPSADGDGVGEVEVCGRVVWPHSDASAPAIRRLVTTAIGPEYADARELLVHRDAAAATAAVEAVREAAASCRTSETQVWTPLERDTGHDTVTVGLTFDQGPGSAIFQVTAIGSATLLVHTYGEGTLASLDAQADEVTATTAEIAPAMCAFTETGC
ncbi:hypothetical protein [Nocardioides sp. SYSU D00065]|uniref:hypothetical protein n=1 Tax=Nocardioides sp. SYSU D00065 TaxID=2817378 RepID=UPI001B329611|nr:hypothetical protein [Nocardioides sp. SYSU D00065]